MNKRLLLLLVVDLTAYATGFAQVRDITFTAGVNVPMYKGIESDATFGVNYGYFDKNGLGFRAGVQWTPSVANIDNSFGLPLAFVWRTASRNTKERLYSGAAGAADVLKTGRGQDDYSTTKGVTGGFLMNLFSDMEFFAGVTPGYIAGTSSTVSKASWGDSWQYWEETWTEKKKDFTCSLDAGMCLNYSIWRFDIKLMPAFHYNVTGNYIYHSTTGKTDAPVTSAHTTPLQWFFSLSGGIAFRFQNLFSCKHSSNFLQK